MLKVAGYFRREVTPGSSNDEDSKKNGSTTNTSPTSFIVNNYFRFPKYKYGKPDTELGKGTTASVTKYRTESSTFAVKIFKYQDKEKYENFESFKKRILKEITIHLLANPNSIDEMEDTHIVKFVDFFSVSRGNLYYVMEPAGQSFPAYYSSHFKHLSNPLKLGLFKQLVTAINYLQMKNINHRDIKPENCCVSETGVLKVIDFGSSIEGDKGYGLVGSKIYVAPEVLTTLSYNPFKSDIWSLGVIFVYFYYFKYVKWSVANDRDDPKFKLFKDNSEQFKYMVRGVEKEPDLGIVKLLLSMLRVKADDRVNTEEILWLLNNIPVTPQNQ